MKAISLGESGWGQKKGPCAAEHLLGRQVIQLNEDKVLKRGKARAAKRR